MILKEFAELVSGKLEGDPNLNIDRVSALAEAGTGSLSFLLEDKNLELAKRSKASALVVSSKHKFKGKNLILVDNPRLALARILKLFEKPCEIAEGVHQTAAVDPSAKIGKGARIGALVYIGPRCEIGEGTIIYPQVSIYADVRIGKKCVIHSGVKIGLDGFGFVPTESGWEKIPQVGSVEIGDNVEIFSNTTVARGALGATRIKSGTKIDCLTHIAHNCEIGENCAVVSLVGFSGSVKIGNNVMVAGQAGFSGHNTVGDNAVIMARAGVTKDVPAGAVVSGFPAVDHKEDLKFEAALRRLAKEK